MKTRFNLIWIIPIAIIYAAKIGAAADLADLNIYDDEEFNYNELRSLRKFTQSRDGNEDADAHKSIEEATHGTAAVAVGVESRNSVSAAAASQVDSPPRRNKAKTDDGVDEEGEGGVEDAQNHGSGSTTAEAAAVTTTEKAETTRKRKTLASKKRKKKRRKHAKTAKHQQRGREQQKNKLIDGVKNENFELRGVGKRAEAVEGSNYFVTTTAPFASPRPLDDVRSPSYGDKSVETATATAAGLSSTTDEVVMEMVEAIIDNNNSINNNVNNGPDEAATSAGSDVNYRDKSAADQSSRSAEVELKPSSRDLNVARSDDKAVVASSTTSSAGGVKINRRSKQPKKNNSGRRRRRRKIMIGDLSCMKAVFIEAPRVANADIKYIRNEMYGAERSFLEAEYHCNAGFRLIRKPTKPKTAASRNLVCRKRRWIGLRPVCVPEATHKSPPSVQQQRQQQQCDSDEAQKCEQLCVKDGNRTEASCQCHKGFRLIGTRCLDIDECEEEAGVCGRHGKCINLIGTHKCLCQQGFRPDNAGKCVDINECLLRGGHGPCQDRCLNTLGGYSCTCEELKGTRLSKDGHSCEEIDLCSVDNGGCSHTCHSTLGQTFCSCPSGFKLDTDWKTCIDIDECQLQEYSMGEVEQKCNYECINTIGSYKCIESREIGADQPFASHDFDDYMTQHVESTDNDYRVGSDDTDGNYDIIDGVSVVSECLNGFYFNETIGNCLDINECEIDNGNCLNGTCVNTNGSFYCSCHKGFVLSEDDKYKCIAVQHKNVTAERPSNRVIVACPPLFPPIHGYLECTRPLESANITGRVKVTNRPGSQCQLRCPSSYRASGTYLKTCGEDGKWHGYDDGICIKYPMPKLVCPQNQLVELPPNGDKVEIKLQKPKTDVNFKRDVTIKPSWIKTVDSITLGLGVLNITYIARHPISKLTVACTTTLFVVDGEAPTVEYCPTSQKHKIEKHHESVKAFWIEPKFSDNVKVADVTQTNLPGTLFGLGSHQIIYEARDAAGYKTRCTFKIVVNAPKHSGLKLPIKNNKFYY